MAVFVRKIISFDNLIIQSERGIGYVDIFITLIISVTIMRNIIIFVVLFRCYLFKVYVKYRQLVPPVGSRAALRNIYNPPITFNGSVVTLSDT